jgi:hypothetical protein
LQSRYALGTKSSLVLALGQEWWISFTTRLPTVALIMGIHIAGVVGLASMKPTSKEMAL